MTSRMRLDPIGLEIIIDGRQSRAETEITPVSPFVLVITTVLEDRGSRFISSYVAACSGPALVTRAWLEDDPTWYDQRTIELTGVSQARACVLDHVAWLQELLAAEADESYPVRVKISERAVDTAARAWRSEG